MLTLLNADITSREAYKFAASTNPTRCYASIPQRGSFSFWNGNSGIKPDYSYDDLLESMIDVIRVCNADLVTVELGEYEFEKFLSALSFPYIRVSTIIYSAISQPNGAICKRRTPTTFVEWSKYKIEPLKMQYSHEYLMKWIGPNDRIFDPFIGKGLAALIALANGASCAGIDYDPDQLAVAKQMKELSQSSGWWSSSAPLPVSS